MNQKLLSLIRFGRIFTSISTTAVQLTPTSNIAAQSNNMIHTLTNTQQQTTNAKQSPPLSTKFDTSILQYIVCPLCKQSLSYDESNNQLISNCTDDVVVSYPIINNIPVLLIDKATRIK